MARSRTLRHVSPRTRPQYQDDPRDNLGPLAHHEDRYARASDPGEPAAGHKLPSWKRRTQLLDMPEIVSLVAHTEERYRPAIWLLALAGLRASELCGLRVMDIDWQEHTLTVNEVQMWVKGELVVKGPKTASGVRTIPLPAGLISDISAAMDRRSDQTGAPILATDRLFTSPTGKPMLDHTIWRIVSRARESAGLPRFRPYDLRHSHASLLIILGAHPKAISERMGHTEIGVTMNVYGHLFEGAQGQLTKDLDDLVERSRPKALGEGGKRADGA